MEQRSYAGELLIAVPELLDPNFNQSVVLVIQHDRDGASGLVLNRASNTNVGELLNEEVELPSPAERIYVGGPVEGPLMAIHGCVSLGEKDVLENVYFSLKRDNLLAIVRQTLRPYRLFCGYSGWGPDQLDQEVAVGGWLVMPATADLVFGPPDKLWQAVSDQIGLEIIFSRPVSQPHDPSVN
jgi:putative transcriptional regulator